MDDPGHPSLRTKPFTPRRGPRKHHRFFTPGERVLAVLLVGAFVVLTVLSITGHVG